MTKKESWSDLSELIGLIVLLAASAWQIFFTDWWKSSANDWQAAILTDMQRETLFAVGELGYIVAEDNAIKRTNYANGINERVVKAAVRSLDERDRRKKALEGQSQLLEYIRITLFLFGSFLMIVGKWVKVSRIRSNP